MEVIIKPVFTEKSVTQAKENCYHFIVNQKANKNMVATAIEKHFGVKVLTVNIINHQSLKKEIWRKGGRRVSSIPGYKKALVSLKEGKIEIFEETKK